MVVKTRLLALVLSKVVCVRMVSDLTKKQIGLLRRMRVGVPENLTIREAGQLIDAAFGTPTPKQAWVLIKAGLDPADFDRKTASEAIDRLKKEKKQ